VSRGGGCAPAGAESAGRRRVPGTLLLVVGGLVAGTVVARRLGYKLGGEVIVRCRRGHLFTTLWIPGVNLKAIDLGIARLQRCPVGHHWSLVTPVRDADLSDEERALARERHDLPIP
jgi:hypothetical protein